jgi:hypothetical protein
VLFKESVNFAIRNPDGSRLNLGGFGNATRLNDFGEVIGTGVDLPQSGVIRHRTGQTVDIAGFVPSAINNTPEAVRRIGEMRLCANPDDASTLIGPTVSAEPPSRRAITLRGLNSLSVPVSTDVAGLPDAKTLFVLYQDRLRRSLSVRPATEFSRDVTQEVLLRVSRIAVKRKRTHAPVANRRL